MTVKSLDEIRQNVLSVQERIREAAAECGRDPSEIRLMAVTKHNDAERVNAAVSAGACLLGENRAQEFLEKYEHYNRKNCEIHFIGSLQTNKVRGIIDKVDLIQSVDRIGLAEEIDRCAARCGRVMPVLVEVNIGREQTKSGVLPNELHSFIRRIACFSHLTVQGLMAIPPQQEFPERNEPYFEQMYRDFIDIEAQNIDNVSMRILSMGMTDDFPYAIRHGSTMIRVGRAIFGERL